MYRHPHVSLQVICTVYICEYDVYYIYMYISWYYVCSDICMYVSNTVGCVNFL